MVRRLVLGMVLMGSAVVAQGLGLGDIQTRSALNQNFDADIDLLSVKTGEIDGVRVTLASADAFKRAGVDRPFFLSQLRFKPVRLPDGRAVIHVSSDQPVQEPFLDFLVEVNWPNGRMLREYTVLLDPPTLTDRRAAPVQAAVASTAPAYSAPTPKATPARQTRQAPRPAVDEYGPIRADETLWAIAKRVRPRGVTMEQMMIALQKANPHAFVRGNINLLKKGQMLRVPAREEILAINRNEAKQAYLSQRDAWMAGQGKPKQAPANAAPQPAATTDSEAGRLQLATPRPTGEGKAGPAEGGATGTAKELSTDLLIARENAETARQEAEHLRSQVNELEMNLRNMDRLIELKDDQLARLQSTMAAEPTTSVEPVTAGEGGVGPDATAAAEAATPPVQPPAGEPVAPTTGEATTTPEGEGTPETATETEAAVAASAEPAPVAAEPAVPAETQKPAKLAGLQALLEDRNVLMGAGAAIIALLAGLLMLASRRRKKDLEGTAADDMGESILLEPEPDESGAEAAPSAAGPDSSFLNEFSPSDVQALNNEDSAEVDPIAEADVYIAYGRYQQAEELIKQALAKEPDRSQLKFKLLDVLYAKPDVAGFVALAKEMAMAGIDSSEPEQWSRVRTMGQELAPDEPLFSGGEVESSEDSVLNEDDTVSMMDDDLHLSELADLAEDESTFVDDLEGRSPALAGLDQNDAEQGAAADELSELESLNLDLDEIESPPSAELDASTAKSETKGLGLAGDADSSLASLDEATKSQDDDLAIDDMDVFSELTEELSQLEEASTLLDEPVDLNAPPPEDELDITLDSKLNDAENLESDLAEDDEVETKLDLARAYIEMGDAEGAIGLLNEVKEEGSPQQASTADKLLGGLDKN